MWQLANRFPVGLLPSTHSPYPAICWFEACEDSSELRSDEIGQGSIFAMQKFLTGDVGSGGKT
jgi:hypothetical protein